MSISIEFQEQKSQNYKIFIDELEKINHEGKVAIVTNPKVAGLHLQTILSKICAKEVYVITVSDGEKYKNFETLNFILDRLFDHRLDRKSLLVALGGGVIGDMTGFAASIFQRGIDFIQIPTTLLSQVDASVGGKTGINNEYGKNLIGSFWQPRVVYCQSAFLKTLPKREFAAGVAEIVKMAVTFDRDFFEWLEKNDLRENDENLRYAIKRSIEIKAFVVAQDEREEGVRAVLNYGHTFCHVIENLTNYETYLHGEAVAMGIDMANSAALALGLLSSDEKQRVENLLKKYDLPTLFKVQNPESFYEAFFLDKKSHNSKIKFIFPKGIGGFEMRTDVSKDLIINILNNYCDK